MSAPGDPQLTWNLVTDVRQLLEFPFMVNAYRAGTVVALLAGLVGWFMVLRRQAFVGHTLAVVGFPGATGAVWLGLSPGVGFFAFCLGGAVVSAGVPGATSGGERAQGALVAIVQAFALACGYLFATLYRGNVIAVNALLFGTFLGITSRQVVVLGVVALGVLASLAVVARPLLFASVDADVAAARGVPRRVLEVLFLLVLGSTAAAVSQITGALLVFALLVLPAATVQRLTARPAVSAAGSAALGVAVTWLGLAAAYYSPYPIGFWVTTFAFGAYVAAQVVSRRGSSAGRPQPAGR